MRRIRHPQNFLQAEPGYATPDQDITTSPASLHPPAGLCFFTCVHSEETHLREMKVEVGYGTEGPAAEEKVCAVLQKHDDWGNDSSKRNRMVFFKCEIMAK